MMKRRAKSISVEISARIVEGFETYCVCNKSPHRDFDAFHPVMNERSQFSISLIEVHCVGKLGPWQEIVSARLPITSNFASRVPIRAQPVVSNELQPLTCKFLELSDKMCAF